MGSRNGIEFFIVLFCFFCGKSGLLDCWLTVFLGCLVAGLPGYWVVGWLFFGVGLVGCWVFGLLCCCVVGLLGCWVVGCLLAVGLLGCWVFGLLDRLLVVGS